MFEIDSCRPTRWGVTEHVVPKNNMCFFVNIIRSIDTAIFFFCAVYPISRQTHASYTLLGSYVAMYVCM